MASANEALVRRLIEEGIGKGNTACVDEVLSSDFVGHPLFYQPVPPPGMNDVGGREAVKVMLAMNRQFIPDLRVTIEKLIEGGDFVTAITSGVGTTRDGKQVTSQGISVYRCSNGKILESWTAVDRLGNFQQLGLVPKTMELMQKAGIRP